LAIWINADNKK